MTDAPSGDTTPLPAADDLDQLADVDGRLQAASAQAALAQWAALTPAQRSQFNRVAWLANQHRINSTARALQKAAAARRGKAAAKHAAEAAAETERVRARTCNGCRLVVTAAGTCDCTG